MKAMSLAEKDLAVAGACFGTGEMKVGVASGADGLWMRRRWHRGRPHGRENRRIDDGCITPGRGTPGEVIGPLPAQKAKLSIG